MWSSNYFTNIIPHYNINPIIVLLTLFIDPYQRNLLVFRRCYKLFKQSLYLKGIDILKGMIKV